MPHHITPHCSSSSPASDVVPIFNRHALGHVIDLVHANESGRELEHVVTQGDNDELGVLGAFLDIARYDGDLWLLLAGMFNYQ
jgi:hypothetical protein